MGKLSDLVHSGLPWRELRDRLSEFEYTAVPVVRRTADELIQRAAMNEYDADPIPEDAFDKLRLWLTPVQLAEVRRLRGSG